MLPHDTLPTQHSTIVVIIIIIIIIDGNEKWCY
jgi:hypothetical protein